MILKVAILQESATRKCAYNSVVTSIYKSELTNNIIIIFKSMGNNNTEILDTIDINDSQRKKHLFTFHVENKLNSHFTWN